MRSFIDRVGGFSLFIIIELTCSIIASIFIVPIIDSDSILSNILVSLIIFVNLFIFLGIILFTYFKEVKSGAATSIIVRICVLFLIVFLVVGTVLIFVF